MNEEKYCIRRLSKIYPHVNKDKIELMAKLILLVVYTGELNSKRKGNDRRI